MYLRKKIAFTVLTSACFLALPAMADTRIENIKGYTFFNNELIQFDAFAFDHQGKIIAVGNQADIRQKTPNAEVINGQGKTVLPGLIDAHGHVFGLGEVLTSVDLRNANNLLEAQQQLQQYANDNPNKPWILGHGWNQVIWKLGRFPNYSELDSIISDRPVYLMRVDAHTAWVNSAALKKAGINKNTPDPAGGKIERDANGNPTGILVDKARDLVEKVIPKTTLAEHTNNLNASLNALAHNGITQVGDAGITAEMDSIYRDFAEKNQLTSRIYAMIGGVENDFDSIVKRPRDNNYSDFYTVSSVKLYGDGALGSRGAALLAPYSDAPHEHGLLFLTDEQLEQKMLKAMQNNYQVNIHAIGDATNQQVINLFEKTINSTNSKPLRHRIEHAQVLTLNDIPRLKSIGIVASMQPTHATSDMNMAEDRLGSERINGAYSWRTFLNQGTVVACGSDFPVESPNPFYGLHAAVNRQDHQNKPLGGWHPEQAISLKEALRCFTLDAAYSMGKEKTTGSLEPNKWADFIMVDTDIFNQNPQLLWKTQVLETWVGGKKVFSKK